MSHSMIYQTTSKTFRKNFHIMFLKKKNACQKYYCPIIQWKRGKKNSADHRKSLLIITNWFIGNLEDHFIANILISLCEIQQILYLPDKNRSPLKILRWLLTTFQHSMLLKMHISTILKSTTEVKFMEHIIIA